MNKSSILIVDDEQPLADFMKKMFEQEDWEALAVYDGSAAVAQIQSQAFDVVLLDMRMPKLDGFATLQRMLQIRPDTCVIFFTAYGDVDSAVKALQMGACSLVVKGPKFEHIFQVVTSTLGLWQQSKEAERLRQQAQLEEAKHVLQLAEARSEANRVQAQGLTHQLKNRLATCGVHISSIEDADDVTDIKQPAAALREAIGSAEQSVKALHDVWQIRFDPSPEFEHLSIAIAATEGFEAAKRNMLDLVPNVRFVSKVPEKLAVQCLQQQLPHVFEILFHNSMQALGNQGGVIALKSKVQSDHVTVRVTDNGPGFTTDMLQHAHLPFVTTKKGANGSGPASNLGIGLWFVKEVVERCEGQLRYGNRDAGGAFVEFTLPLARS